MRRQDDDEVPRPVQALADQLGATIETGHRCWMLTWHGGCCLVRARRAGWAVSVGEPKMHTARGATPWSALCAARREATRAITARTGE